MKTCCIAKMMIKGQQGSFTPKTS